MGELLNQNVFGVLILMNGIPTYNIGDSSWAKLYPEYSEISRA
jgi:hypothetical protein